MTAWFSVPWFIKLTAFVCVCVCVTACACGSRLCESVTGDCICPPRTVRPECTQCEPQTFGCHPLVGCEVCNCSRPGVTSPDVSCDTASGQCR